MPGSSWGSNRSPIRRLPYNLHVSICVILPLALAFLVSTALWDVLCFSCGSEQQSRAANLQAAKQRTRSRSAGPVGSSAIQRPAVADPMPDDEPDLAEALDYIFESEYREGDDSATKREGALDPDEVPNAADHTDGRSIDSPSKPSSSGNGASPDADDEEFLDETPEDYDPLYGAESDGEGNKDSAGGAPAGSSTGDGAAKAKGAPGGAAEDSLDGAEYEEVYGQLDEFPEDYDSLYGEQGGGGEGSKRRQGGGAASPQQGPAPLLAETAKNKAGVGANADKAPGDSGRRSGDGAPGGRPGVVDAAADGVGGGGGPAATSSDGADAPATEYEYGFKLLPPASLKYSDVVPCTDGAEPAEEVFQPLHPGLNMLVLLGVQKGGTTWMASALMKHPALFRAKRFYGGERRTGTKEVHYLDYWPHTNGSEAVYVDGFPQAQVAAAKQSANAQLKAAGVRWKTLKNAAGVRNAYEHLTHDVAFFDPTPNYFPVAHVPPRASQIMPHARFVIVLRDPVARALSAYNMDRSRFCDAEKDPFFFLPETVCSDTGFTETVANTTGMDERGDTCMFDGLDGGAPKTWHDCYKCHHMFFDRDECSSMPEPRPFDDCSPEVLNYVHVSNYAAQLAWWLAFFPPEQFLILTSAELRDPDRQINALNRVLKHAKLPNARRFTRKWLDSMATRPFAGKYEEEDTAVGVPEAIGTLRERFQKPMEDLNHLVNRFWPHLNFTGLPDEV